MDIVTLERSKQHWQFAADSLPQLLFLLDLQGRIVRANNTIKRWGLGDVFSIGGRPLHEALHPNCGDADCYLPTFVAWAVSELGAGRHVQCEAFDPVLNRFFAIRAEPARPEVEQRAGAYAMPDVLAVVTFEDVTDLRCPHDRLFRLNRELGDQVLREMDKRKQVEAVWMRMQTIVERTASFIAMTDPAGALLYLNPAGRHMLGIAASEDVAGIDILDLHAAAVREQMSSAAFPQAIATGSWTGRSVLRSRAGADIETLQTVIAHKTPGGRHEGMSVVIHDMTAWAQGEAALRQSHQELRRLSAQLISVHESERRRIATELHDGLGQTLSVVQMRVVAALRQIGAGATDAAMDALKATIPLLKDAMVEARRLSSDLHPASLEDLGILPTLSWFFRELESSQGGIAVNKSFSVRETDVPPSLRVAIFRILQEAVSNVVTHAEPTRIDVKLQRRGDDLHLCIEDDGNGFDPGNIDAGERPERGFGLSSMKERAELTGGSYQLQSAIGRGTRIQVVWPCAASA